MRTTTNIFKNKKGFTLIEAVLCIVISSIMVGVTSQAMIGNLTTYAFISNRQATLSDMRYAMNLMTNELTRITTATIQSISANSITFTDINGNGATYSTGMQNGELTLLKNNEALAGPITSFTLTYRDQNNNVTASIANVRKIQLTLTSAAQSDEGTIALTTTVIPRNFLYANYQ